MHNIGFTFSSCTVAVQMRYKITQNTRKKTIGNNRKVINKNVVKLVYYSKIFIFDLLLVLGVIFRYKNSEKYSPKLHP